MGGGRTSDLITWPPTPNDTICPALRCPYREPLLGWYQPHDLCTKQLDTVWNRRFSGPHKAEGAKPPQGRVLILMGGRCGEDSPTPEKSIPGASEETADLVPCGLIPQQEKPFLRATGYGFP